MVILKKFNLEKAEINSSLNIFGTDIMCDFNLNENVMADSTFRFEVSMYWATYYYADKINNIVAFQNFVREKISEKPYGFAYLERNIIEYLGVKNECKR